MLVIRPRIGYKKSLGLNKQKKAKSTRSTSHSDINHSSQDTSTSRVQILEILSDIIQKLGFSQRVFIEKKMSKEKYSTLYK